MSLVDGVVLFAIIVGAFFCGVVWSPLLADLKVADALEATSYVATIIACVVAVITLSAWRYQFRHAERYSTLKDLKVAATDLYNYRGFLLAVKRSCDYQITHAGEVDPELRSRELEKRQLMLEAIASYNKAWAAAVGFLTAEEESRIVGTPNKFALLSMERPDQLIDAFRLCLGGGPQENFDSSMEQINREAMHIYAVTVGEIERLLREKA